MDIRRALVIAVLGLAVVGCGAKSESSSGILKVGDTGDLPGLRLSVTKVVVGGDDHGPWLQVWFRMKNVSDHEVRVPVLDIVCAGNDTPGSLGPTPDRNYGIKPGARIFVGSSADGVMRLLSPGDLRDGKRPVCATPAYVRVTGKDDALKVPIPDATVKGLNDY